MIFNINYFTPSKGMDSLKMHKLCAPTALNKVICTALVAGLPSFASVHRLDLGKMLHLQKLAHQHRTAEIGVSAAQTCARGL
jgi:hypothetical protein